MWVCSKLGFFSIVKKGRPDTWQVRARSESDLQLLVNAATLNTDILSTPTSDYAYRIVVDTEDLSRVFAVLVYSIDYPNFKSCLETVPQQQDKLGAYHEFWAKMRKLQEGALFGNGPSSDTTRFQCPEDIAKTFGGHLSRVLETLNGFKDKYGHWPTKLRLPASAYEALRDKHLTRPGFQVLQSKLELVAGENEKLVAEDEAGLKFDYSKEGWLGKKTPTGSDEWLWHRKLTHAAVP
jgi:hypothetical protein